MDEVTTEGEPGRNESSGCLHQRSDSDEYSSTHTLYRSALDIFSIDQDNITAEGHTSTPIQRITGNHANREQESYALERLDEEDRSFVLSNLIMDEVTTEGEPERNESSGCLHQRSDSDAEGHTSTPIQRITGNHANREQESYALRRLDEEDGSFVLSNESAVYFDDKKRRIDFVLAHPMEKLNIHEKNCDFTRKNRRDLFERCLREEGLHLEEIPNCISNELSYTCCTGEHNRLAWGRAFQGNLTEEERHSGTIPCILEESKGCWRFVKIHCPWEVLREHGEILKFKMPMKKVSCDSPMPILLTKSQLLIPAK